MKSLDQVAPPNIVPLQGEVIRCARVVSAGSRRSLGVVHDSQGTLASPARHQTQDVGPCIVPGGIEALPFFDHGRESFLYMECLHRVSVNAPGGGLLALG